MRVHLAVFSYDFVLLQRHVPVLAHRMGRLLLILVRKEPECLRQACRRLLREECLIHISPYALR